MKAFGSNTQAKRRFALTVSVVLMILIASMSHRAMAKPQTSDSTNSSARALVHILDYISQDYAGAVNDGKVTSASEYNEQKQLANTASSLLGDLTGKRVIPVKSDLSQHMGILLNRIQHKEPADSISASAQFLKNEIIKITGMAVAPSSWPDVMKGRQLFAALCVNCHGKNGAGDGKLAEQLNPHPTDFVHSDRMVNISPFQAFNTIKMGIQGTGMAPFRQLTDKQAWDLAFYVKSLRFTHNQPALTAAQIDSLPVLYSKIDLTNLATLNDEQLSSLLRNDGINRPDQILPALRSMQHVPRKNNSLALAHSYLKKAKAAYSSGDVALARQRAVMAYLEGVEPVEPSLRANDPSLMSTLEQQMTSVRGAIESKKSSSEVDAAINLAQGTLSKANMVLDQQVNSPWFSFVMAASILLREGLEAFLIILAILGVIRALGEKKAALWVHGGWILALALGIVSWFFTDWIIGFGAAHRELMEGSISLLAVIVLLYVGFWLHSKTEIHKWTEFIDVRVKNMLKGGNLFGLAAIAFFAVFREAFESVLFLSALSIEEGQGSKYAIAGGALAAIVIVLILAAILLRYSAKLPLKNIFKYSSFVMGVLSFVLVGKGIHAIQETGMLSVTAVPFNLNIGLIGFYPTLQTIIAQTVILILLIILWNYPNWKARRAYA